MAKKYLKYTLKSIGINPVINILVHTDFKMINHYTTDICQNWPPNRLDAPLDLFSNVPVYIYTFRVHSILYFPFHRKVKL